MRPMPWLFIIPLLCAALRLITRKYVFSALTTLSCAGLIALSGLLPAAPFLFAGLLASVVGDWFLAHTQDKPELYACGVIGFLAGHLLFIVHAARHMRFSAAALAIALALTVGYGFYMARRILPRTPGLLKIPLSLYALVSLGSIACAMMTGNPLYIAGIALLVFSDTMIAENDFAGNHRAKYLILPTYYLCHLLITLSIFSL